MPLHAFENGESDSDYALVRELIKTIDPNPDRPGLADTPRRVVESWKELFAGYAMNPDEILKQFDHEKGYDELVLVKDIEFYSTCEHHMLPFFGKAHVAYISGGTRIYGLSKLARLVDCFSRRLTVQEKITQEVAETLKARSLAAACVIEATHLCMCSRGVRKTGAKTVTSYLRGAFFDKPSARSELFALIHGK